MYIAGLILIILGLVFFLENMGLIPYDTWNNIWPLLLILIGLGLMFGRRGMRPLRGMGRGYTYDGPQDWRKREDRSMGGAESRAYGHDESEEERKARMHDKREDEV